jgi:hypothetical protein
MRLIVLGLASAVISMKHRRRQQASIIDCRNDGSIIYDELIEQGFDPAIIQKYCHEEAATKEAWYAIGMAAIAGESVLVVKPTYFTERGQHALLAGNKPCLLANGSSTLAKPAEVMKRGEDEMVYYHARDIADRHTFYGSPYGRCVMVRRFAASIPRVVW